MSYPSGTKGTNPHVTLASGPTRCTHIKDLTAWNWKATLRISTCIHRAFLAVYRHNHLAAKRFPGREGGEGLQPRSRQRDQHPAEEQRRGLPRLRAAERAPPALINNFRVNSRPPLPSASPLSLQASSYS